MRRLDKERESYGGMTEREFSILQSGWAQCETHIGIERLREDDDLAAKLKVATEALEHYVHIAPAGDAGLAAVKALTAIKGDT